MLISTSFMIFELESFSFMLPIKNMWGSMWSSCQTSFNAEMKCYFLFFFKYNELVLKNVFIRYNLQYRLEDKFWPPAAVAVNVQSLLHANTRYLWDKLKSWMSPTNGLSFILFVSELPIKVWSYHGNVFWWANRDL